MHADFLPAFAVLRRCRDGDARETSLWSPPWSHIRYPPYIRAGLLPLSRRLPRCPRRNPGGRSRNRRRGAPGCRHGIRPAPATPYLCTTPSVMLTTGSTPRSFFSGHDIRDPSCPRSPLYVRSNIQESSKDTPNIAAFCDRCDREIDEIIPHMAWQGT